MKISRENKLLLFEQEFVALAFMVVLGLLAHSYSGYGLYYFLALALGFILYFWMVHEEKVHATGKKHEYFEHTSSYLMIAQTAFAVQLVAGLKDLEFLAITCVTIYVIMYSVALSRIVMFKVVFKDEHKV